MKTKILSIFAIALASILALSSCSESWEPKTEREGQVSLASIGVEISSEMETISRAEHDLSGFLVRIYAEDGTLTQQWTYANMPEIFSLPVGKYRVDVCSHEIQKAEWDKPYYEGSKEFTIEDSKITEIGVVKCVFASLRVSVVFTDDLVAAMGDDVKVTVVANDEGSMVFTPTETRSAYFEVIEGSTTLAATFSGTVKGYTEYIHRVYTDIKAGQHRIITFSLKDNTAEPPAETGNVDPTDGVNVDMTITDVYLDGSVSADEDVIENPNRPGGEDFNDSTEPETPGTGTDTPTTPNENAITFTSALRFDTPMTTDEPDGKVVVHADAGIAHFYVYITTTADDATFQSITSALNGTDLVSPGDMKESLDGLGLANGDAVLNQKEVTFDITQFIGLLKGFKGTHKFTLDVTDNDGNNAVRNIIFQVN